MIEVNVNINGQKVTRAVEPRTHLGDFIRNDIGLTGTNLSCEHGVCGSCTVLVDGKPVRSCITFAGACEGKDIVTIEGYDEDPIMLRLRQAFHVYHALQCGFCTPGMLATSRDIVLRLPDANDERIRIELAGNICRCTGYQGIVQAVRSVLQELQDNPDEQVDALRAAVAINNVAAVQSQPFTPFEAQVETPAASEPTPKAAEKPSASSPKGNIIESDFELSYPLERVWEFMSDLKAVAACLPGAELDEQVGDEVKGRVAIRFGPMSASFDGQATLQRDDVNHTAVLKGAGVDSLSNSRARGDVEYSLHAIGPDKTRVAVSLDYGLQGPLAQFSRSGLVQDFVKRLIREFSKNVEVSLGNKPLSSTGKAKQLNPVVMLISIYWEKFLSLFKSKK